jgi:hypothetical protein
MQFILLYPPVIASSCPDHITYFLNDVVRRGPLEILHKIAIPDDLETHLPPPYVAELKAALDLYTSLHASMNNQQLEIDITHLVDLPPFLRDNSFLALDHPQVFASVRKAIQDYLPGVRRIGVQLLEDREIKRLVDEEIVGKLVQLSARDKSLSDLDAARMLELSLAIEKDGIEVSEDSLDEEFRNFRNYDRPEFIELKSSILNSLSKQKFTSPCPFLRKRRINNAKRVSRATR